MVPASGRCAAFEGRAHPCLETGPLTHAHLQAKCDAASRVVVVQELVGELRPDLLAARGRKRTVEGGGAGHRQAWASMQRVRAEPPSCNQTLTFWLRARVQQYLVRLGLKQGQPPLAAERRLAHAQPARKPTLISQPDQPSPPPAPPEQQARPAAAAAQQHVQHQAVQAGNRGGLRAPKGSRRRGGSRDTLGQVYRAAAAAAAAAVCAQTPLAPLPHTRPSRTQPA